MSNKNTLWWVLLAIWATLSTWWHTCKIKELCDAPLITKTSVPSAAVTISPLQITDGTAFSLISAGNFGFAKSGSEPNFSAVQPEIDSLASYLKVNTNRQVTITGYYSSEEANHSSWPNLGLARAERIKEYYVNQGLPADMFLTVGELRSDIRFDSDSLKGGIGFSLAKLPTAEDKLADAQKFDGIFNPLDLYFNTGSSEYIVTSENQKFVNEAKRYLSANGDKKLLLIGHTDSTGDAAANDELSRARAEQAKKQLIALGLPANQLITDAKGQRVPKQSNETTEGRAANRRVEIVVQ
jgi:OOP family OmpA-OmpF porin